MRVLQERFSIGNIILAYLRKLKMIYNRKYFLKVLYFFLNEACSTCNDDNLFVSAEIYIANFTVKSQYVDLKGLSKTVRLTNAQEK